MNDKKDIFHFQSLFILSVRVRRPRCVQSLPLRENAMFIATPSGASGNPHCQIYLYIYPFIYFYIYLYWSLWQSSMSDLFLSLSLYLFLNLSLLKSLVIFNVRFIQNVLQVFNKYIIRYGLLILGLQAFIVYKCVTRFLTYISLPWPQVAMMTLYAISMFAISKEWRGHYNKKHCQRHYDPGVDCFNQ